MTRSRFLQPEDLSQLAQPIQQWVREKRWPSFWPIQRFTIDKLLRERQTTDLILAAPTAGGKTMAAFLPLLSEVSRTQANGNLPGGYEVLYVSPLKALIRQQSSRDNDLVTLAAAVGRPVVPWMGDIDHSIKNKSWDNPSGGILIITPESLEARFLRRSSDIASRFSALRAVVVDELHDYFESPRGPQLISLLTRLEASIGRTVQRIALSGTLGSGDERDWERIYCFLRPGAPEPPPVAGDEQHGKPPTIKICVKLDEDRTDQGDGARRAIAADLRAIFDAEHKTGLIFTNSRRESERFANLLNTDDNAVDLPPDWAMRRTAKQDARHLAAVGRRSRPQGSPGMDAHFESSNPAADRRRYWPHHGSLDKAIRTQGESRMRSQEVSCTLIATTTLELGIDVGAVEEVAQIGPGHSVASLRQRMGRSGRPTLVVGESGEVQQLSPPPKLHIFIREPGLSGGEHVLDRLRLPTFQALAQVCLLRAGRFEAPNLDQLHLSTFVQQLLSLIHQHRESGLEQRVAERILLSSGPFSQLGQPLFEEIPDSISIFDAVIERLRTRLPPLVDLDLAEPDAGRRELFLTGEGEKVVGSHSFYAAFRTPVEYVLQAATGILGTLSQGASYGTGDRILFAGRAWEITAIDHVGRRIEVRPASQGKAAHFTGDALAPSEEVVAQMKRLYEMDEAELDEHVTSIADLDPIARRMLAEGRQTYGDQDLASKPWVQVGGDLFLFPWVGHHTSVGIAAALRWAEISASPFRMAIFLPNRGPAGLAAGVRRLLGGEPLGFPTMRDLARRCGYGATGKFDHYLSPSLRRRDFASSQLGSATMIRQKLEELEAALSGASEP